MTNFTSIYDKFLSKITDFSIAQMEQTLLEEQLKDKVLTALANFPSLAEEKKVIDDSEPPSFVLDLSLEEQEIIALLMVVDYFDKFIVNEDSMRIQLNSKDYKMYSQATLLKELKATKSFYKNQVDAKMNAYNFRMRYKARKKPIYG